ncbi:DUF2795 domain-containing protein [Actinoalloteichus sp. AHMU CJ021]|uniref:DUF2795 domain-containing protein n=1 Tax=Actinoalloteichus caeruleus DSM 43889 TaxID=1120930 RepID=A0ABT1JBG0_ACTCY|nr:MULTISPECIES: DUF2795 domain-containing protein [Actinoalloteichus]AUS80493.1 DUF2795 domain-containing protein [Actinoalloteichus sp. AHMU CJ021]MCP2329841.1 Protein of unknown function (DUF2795) [Actinoalloteichus caeruleus DSM 43889]
MASANPIQMQKSLKDLDYPASTDQIVEHAQQHGADENILSGLRKLPKDRTFDGPNAVSEAFSKV